MSHYLTSTSKVILEKYEGNLDNLRKAADHKPEKELELIREFKVSSLLPLARHGADTAHCAAHVACSC